MYRVIFIDDEAITLNLLRSAIDWRKYNIEICGTASDGEEGIELVRQVEPNIVIADIRMPKMSGIALSGAIRQTNKKVKIVLLSAYAEFQYAQSAIQYQISDYLLKPLDEDQLEKTIARIVEDLEQENSISMRMVNYRLEHAEKQLQQFLIQNHETHNTCLNIAIPQEVLEIYTTCDRLLDVISTDITQDLTDYSYMEAVMQFFKDRWGSGIGVALITPIELVVLTTASQIQRDIGSIPSALRAQGKPVRIGVSTIARPFELCEAYQQAQSALYQSFYSGEEVCACLDQFHFSEQFNNNLADFERQIIELVEQGKCDELIRVFQTRLADLFLKRVYPPQIYDFVVNVLTWINIVIAKQYRNDVLNSLYMVDRKRLQLCASKDDLFVHLNFLLRYASQVVQEFLSQDTIYYVVRQAKEYTRANYTRTDFSLQDVSDFVGLSKNHFSKVFHDSTGQKFWDYVTFYRIERAKEYLRNSNRSNYDIGRSIGYESEFYFSKIFKRIVGVSPQQYRKR